MPRRIISGEKSSERRQFLAVELQTSAWKTASVEFSKVCLRHTYRYRPQASRIIPRFAHKSLAITLLGSPSTFHPRFPPAAAAVDLNCRNDAATKTFIPLKS
jgi:hypothetical protein